MKTTQLPKNLVGCFKVCANMQLSDDRIIKPIVIKPIVSSKGLNDNPMHVKGKSLLGEQEIPN
jgi:hypothetical protein